jgi:CubicO group peptidase (beta-lactamase class C family)
MVTQTVVDADSPGTGMDDEALAQVERLFHTQISSLRLHPGAALAVYCRGRLVLDLVGGYADTQSGEAVRLDTLFVLFSSTKPLASVALWQQIERGNAGLDDPVAAYWSAFAQQGKERVTLRHVLSHRGGFPLTPPEVTRERWGDWAGAIRAIEAMPLSYEPGAVSAYHQLTQQWVCAELVQRLAGRSYADYLRAELFGPLGMDDTYVGLPADLAHRVAKLHATDGTDDWGCEAVRTVNGLTIYRWVVPAASGVAPACDLARFYAALAAGGVIDGVRILQPETVARMLAIEVDGETDRTFDVPVRRGLGFELGGLADRNRFWAGAGSTARTFGHGGFGTSICWGDRDLDLAMVFVTNGVRRDEAGATARRDLSDAVRSLCT